MTAYIAALVAAAGVYAILSSIAPKSEETRRAVYLVLSFSLLVFLLSPLTSGELQGDFSALLDGTLPEYEIGDSYFTEETRAAVTDGIARAVTEKFGLSSGTLRVECDFEDGVTPTAVRLYLSGVGIFADLRGIEAYGKENFCESCEVILDVK